MFKKNLNLISSIFKGHSLLRAYQINECKNIKLKGNSIEFGAYKNKKKILITFLKEVLIVSYPIFIITTTRIILN